MSKQEVPAVQSDNQPLGVESAKNVENPGRELPLVETEEQRTKAQMKKTQEDLEQEQADELAAAQDWDDSDGDEPFFGNEDKKELNEIPGTFDKNAQGYVIVLQKRKEYIEGAGMTELKHAIPFQAYNEQIFNKLVTPNADGKTPFQQQGIVATVLHDTRSAKSKRNFKI